MGLFSCLKFLLSAAARHGHPCDAYYSTNRDRPGDAPRFARGRRRSRFPVPIPDLPGIGDSEAPSSPAVPIAGPGCEVLLLNWGDVTDNADMFEQILARFYADLDPAVVTTRQLQSPINSNNNRSRKNITIPEVHLVEILHHGVEKWFDVHGLMYSPDVEPAVGVEQFFYFQVKQRKNVGTISYVIDSQTGANLPLHKALYDIDQSIPVTVQRKRWPDLRPFGFSTGARKGEDKRPPGGKITVKQGPIIQHAVTGDRYRMWTQVVRSDSILLPPHITIRETLPATPSATTVTSEPL